ncbi:GxxExxY protein [Desulfonema magnum]|uniref:GxxExxY domain-containing protein n=1 Tax=Desulfonema magnum TaxID=45655 RepID=A0A975GPV3_9BACT|nr:GxxExxY protein [Desulfonema magnum]QTA89247.1 GxxExxY domain-containing protein [Desulfonema magnum]
MHEELTYAINNCLFEVFRKLGNIWNENVYESAAELELRARGMKTERQKEFDVLYFDRRVGRCRTDLLVENTVIVELKAVRNILPLHRAQLISYLKGMNMPLGILANFGGFKAECRTFPNIASLKTPLRDDFDFDKIRLEGKETIKELLFMANRILTTLGVGYVHHIYRRAFYCELKEAGIDFEIKKEVIARYRNQTVGSREVIFFIMGDLLLSAMAVRELDDLILHKFCNYGRYLKKKRGLIFNFNSLHLDFRYFSDMNKNKERG